MSIGAVRDPGFAQAGDASPLPRAGVPKPKADDASPFARVLEGLGREVQRGESIMQGAIDAAHAGVSISPAELIALQAGVYRYSEVVELASRLIDRAEGSVKTIVQGQ